MKYGLFSGGKKVRSKILIDAGSIFKIDYKTLIMIGSAIECIHAYSLIHDDLPCMDNDTIRRGKQSTHIKFGESTAVLAGNSLLTMAFEILTHKDLKTSQAVKVDLVNKLSESAGHLGIAGGQYLDLSYEHKKVSKKRVLEMEIKKTGKLFSFCCVAPVIIKKRRSIITGGIHSFSESRSARNWRICFALLTLFATDSREPLLPGEIIFSRP